MNILVTGGSGFIGSNLIQYLLSANVTPETGLPVSRVVNLDALTYAANPLALESILSDSRYHFVQGSVLDPALISKILRQHQISAIMHLASESHVDRSIQSPETFATTNFLGTFHLLEAFRVHLATLPHPIVHAPLCQNGSACFLQVSTDEVFGSLRPDEPPFSESSPLAPNSPYSAAKAGADLMTRAYQQTYDIPTITTRCSNNYGPWQHVEKLIPHMISRAIQHQPLPIYGDGSQVRDWIHVSDHCRALCSALWSAPPRSTFVIGANCEIRNIDLVQRLVDLIRELAPHLKVPPASELIRHVQDRPGHDTRYATDSSLLTHITGWKPQISIHAGLESTVSWYLNHLRPS